MHGAAETILGKRPSAFATCEGFFRPAPTAARSGWKGRSKGAVSPFPSRALATIAALAVVLPSLIGFCPAARGHSGDVVRAAWLRNPVTVDGNVTGGEWLDATEVNLTAADSANAVAAYLYLKNDAAYVYAAYDAVGDTHKDDNDHASIAFDTGHDGVATNAKEDQFFQSTPNNLFTMLEPPGNQAHFFYSNGVGDWVADCNPFDPGLPGHAGLGGGIGFGRSARQSATDHRMYEFRVPLSLLGLSPGDTVGFLGASARRRGVHDTWSGLYSAWPRHFASPPAFAEYGDLVLAASPADPPPVIGVFRPGATAMESYRVGDPIGIEWTATDDRPLPANNVNITFGSGGTWASINGGAYGHANDGLETWDTMGVAPGSYYVNASAYDSAGQTTYAWSNFSVALTTDRAPPEIRNVRLDGQPTRTVRNGTTSVEVNATVSDATTGGTPVVGANFTVGIANWASARSMTLIPGPGVTVNATGTLDASALAPGTYAIAVYAWDAADNQNVTATGFATLDVLARTPPKVVSATPSGSGVPTNADMVVVFSEPMNRTSVEGAVALSPAVPFTSTWSADGRTLTIHPGQPLARGTAYTVSISGTVAEDLEGDKFDGDGNGAEGGDFRFSFTTEGGGGGDSLLWIGLAAALVVAAVFLFLFWRRSRRREGRGGGGSG